MDTISHPGPKEVFLQLFVIVTLYLVAVHAGILSYQLINLWMPDAVADGYGRGMMWQNGPLRWALAMLIVATPIHAWTRRTMHRVLAANSEARAMRTRRWLGYFTVFAAGIIATVDLVALVNELLKGELTWRFALKVLTVAVVAAVVFVVEREELRWNPLVSSQRLRVLHVGVGVVLLAGVITGIAVGGTPTSARWAEFDQQRIQHLSEVQWRIVDYWQVKRTLPPSLDVLRDDLSGFVAPMDPENGTPYAYRALGDLQFELCANFRTENVDAVTKQPRPMAPYPAPHDAGLDVWQHGGGRQCFTRTIDPDRYPPRPVRVEGE